MLTALLFASGLAEAIDAEVHKHPQCGCCIQWGRHLAAAGFDVTVVPALDNEERWRRFEIPRNARACHTAVVDGYLIEGHAQAFNVLLVAHDGTTTVFASY